MASLLNCPNELLVRILCRLKGRDLATICLVCHHLHTLAEPFLYRNVSLDTWPRWPRSRNHSFLLTLLNRPTLVNCVQDLSLQWFFPDDSDMEPADHPEIAEELVRFRATALSVGLLQQPVSNSVQIMLLLHLLPSLRVLNIRFHSPRTIFIDVMEEQATLPRPSLPIGLQSLQHFTCTYSNRYSGASLVMLLGLFALPSIRILDVCLNLGMQFTPDNDDGYDDEETRLDITSPDYARTSTVTDLRFSYGGVSAWSVGRILQIPRALTRFSYGQRIPGGRDMFDIAMFRVALQSISQTLQSLVLCFAEDPYVSGAIVAEPETIGSLREWPVLGHLRCPLSLLVGGSGCQIGLVVRLADVLPTVIREVRIASDEYWSDVETGRQMVETVELKYECGLHRLAMVYVQDSWGVEEQLRAVCDAALVALVVVSV